VSSDFLSYKSPVWRVKKSENVCSKN